MCIKLKIENKKLNLTINQNIYVQLNCIIFGTMWYLIVFATSSLDVDV
jgi:hypothetical protein